MSNAVSLTCALRLLSLLRTHTEQVKSPTSLLRVEVHRVLHQAVQVRGDLDVLLRSLSRFVSSLLKPFLDVLLEEVGLDSVNDLWGITLHKVITLNRYCLLSPRPSLL